GIGTAGIGSGIVGGALKGFFHLLYFLGQQVTDGFDFHVLDLADPVDRPGSTGTQADKAYPYHVDFGSSIAGHVEALAMLSFALLKYLIQFGLSKTRHSGTDQPHAGQFQKVTSVIVH